MLPSRYNMAVGHMISGQVWLSTKDFHKIKPVENSNLDQGRELRIHLLAE